MNKIVLAADGVEKIYRADSREVRAVNGVTCQIREGESVSIVGPSGAGKSTLLHMLGGLDTPTRGTIMIGDADVYKLSDKERAKIRNRYVGFVFQFYYLLPEFNALENVMLPATIGGKKAKDLARQILAFVGLDERMTHKPNELSGGEAQRVAIARALINEPDAILCDEPTGNLDSATSESILRLLFNIKTKLNTALVIVTHDENVTKLTDSVLHLKDGMLV